MARFVSVGDSVEVVPVSDVDAGQVVVQGALVGVAHAAIAAGATGAIAVRGVFEVEKDSSTVSVGDLIYFDSSADQATTTETGNTLMGKAVAAAASADETVKVLM